MTATTISYQIRGTAPRTLFDILNTEDDTEGGTTSLGDFDAEYDEYVRPRYMAGTKPTLLS